MSDGDTRQKLLGAGLEIMLSQGYSATSIDHVCSSAGVSKGSFYHFFSTKEEFGLAVLDAFYQRGVERVESGEYHTVADSRERVLAFFDHMEEIAPELWRHGCLLGSFASELAESSPRIRNRVGELFDGLEKKLMPVFLGVVDDEDEARDLASEMLALLEGTIVIARAHGEPERIGEAVRRFRRSVQARIPEIEGAGSA